MASELLIVNPRRHYRRTRIHHRRRHRVRAHTIHRRGRRIRVRSHMSNPRHRVHRVRHHRRHHRSRRNPMGGVVDDVLMPGLLGAAGGVGLQLLWNAFGTMLPCAITGNTLITVVAQGAAGVGLGALAGMALGKSKGEAVAVGAVAIVLYNYAASLISSSPALSGLRGRRIGAYIPGSTGPNGRTFYAPVMLGATRHPLAPRRGMGAYAPGQGLKPVPARKFFGRNNYQVWNPAPVLRGARGMNASGPMAKFAGAR